MLACHSAWDSVHPKKGRHFQAWEAVHTANCPLILLHLLTVWAEYTVDNTTYKNTVRIEWKCTLKTPGAKPSGISFSINRSHRYVSVDIIIWLPIHLLCVSYYCVQSRVWESSVDRDGWAGFNSVSPPCRKAPGTEGSQWIVDASGQ